MSKLEMYFKSCSSQSVNYQILISSHFKLNYNNTIFYMSYKKIDIVKPLVKDNTVSQLQFNV